MTVAITRNALTAGKTGSPGASTATASITNTAGALVLLAVCVGDTGGAPVAPSSISGLGLTWIGPQYDAIGNVGCAVFYGQGASSTGTITITWGTGTDNGLWQVDEFVGVPGSSPIGLIANNSANSATPSVNLGGTPAATSAVYAAVNHNDTANTVTAGSGFTLLGTDDTQGTPSAHRAVEWNNAGSAGTTAGFTFSGAGNYGMVALEIKAAAGPTDAGAIASAEAFGSPQINADLSPSGIASAEAFGLPTIGLAGGVWPDFFVEVAWANKALDLDANVVWTDITAYLRSFRLSRSRSRELARFDAGTLDMILDNRDGRFSPEYSGSAYFPYVRPNKRVRVRAGHGPVARTLINVYANSWSEQFMKPKDAIVAFSGTDAFKLLAQYALPDAWALAVQALGPKAWWRLNERTGLIFYDSASWTGTPVGPFPATITGSTVTLDQNPVVPGADSNVSRSAAFSGTGEGKVLSPGILPTTTTTSSIVFRAASKAYNLTAPTSLTVSKPTGVVQNDVMIAGVEIRGDKTVTGVPSGWTLLQSQIGGSANNQGAFLYVYWKQAGASEPSTYKWTFSSGGDAAIVIGAWSGCPTSSPIDTSAIGVTGDNTANCIAPSVSPANNNSMLVTIFGHNPDSITNATYSTSTPSLMTEAADTNSQNNSGAGANRASVAMDYVAVASGATGAKTGVLSGGAKHNVGCSVALKPASGAGSVATPFTVAFWFEQAANQGNNDIFVKQGNAATTGMDVFQDVLTTGDLKLVFRLGGNTLRSAAALTASNGLPVLVVVRYDGATGMALDVKGSGVNTSTSSVITAVSIVAADWEFGLAECSMDEVTVWPSYLTNAQVATLTAISLGTSFTTAVVDAALTQVGWASDLRQIQPDLVSGQLMSNLATASSAGDKALDFLQGAPVETERGVLYMTGDGKVAFEPLSFLQGDASRSTIVATFGQGVGEIGYSDLAPDFSDQIIVNDVQITNTNSNNGAAANFSETFNQQDAASMGEFSRYTLPLTTNYDGALATRQTNAAARMAFELTRYAQPQRRIQSLTFEGTNVAADWTTLLALGMLQRVRVNHVGPDGATTIAKDYTIRGFEWEYTASPKSVKLVLGLDEGAIPSAI